MKRSQLIFFNALFLMAMTLSPVSAANDEDIRFDHRLIGDRIMAMNLGPFLPLFFQDTSGKMAPTNLSVGGLLGLDIEFYLNNNVRLGGGIRGAMSMSPNGRSFFMVPITFNSTYEIKFWPFTVPVSLGVGGNFSSYQGGVNFEPIIVPGTGFYWNSDGTWAFGLNAKYWWVPQFYIDPPWKTDQNRFGNFLELSLCATYHFL